MGGPPMLNMPPESPATAPAIMPLLRVGRMRSRSLKNKK